MAAASGVGLSWQSNLTQCQRPRFVFSKPPRRSSATTITMTVSVNEKQKTFTLQKSEDAFNKAKELMPGGVNSPVRAFKSVGGQPVVIDSVKGAHMWDIDGNKYIDYVGSWGPAIIGHADDEGQWDMQVSYQSRNFSQTPKHVLQHDQSTNSCSISYQPVQLYGSSINSTFQYSDIHHN